MTGKEKSEKIKHEMADKKKHTAKHATQTVPETNEPEKQEKVEDQKVVEDKLNELQDKYLRLSAEFDNYRKRTLKEKSEMIKTASEDLIKKLIPFVDDIERGLDAVNTSTDLEAVKLGMNLIYGRFREFLQLNGVQEIEALNQEFNTDLHEAVTKIPVPDESQKGKVVDVILKGYLLHDKVIRYPKVVIGE